MTRVMHQVVNVLLVVQPERIIVRGGVGLPGTTLTIDAIKPSGPESAPKALDH